MRRPLIVLALGFMIVQAGPAPQAAPTALQDSALAAARAAVARSLDLAPGAGPGLAQQLRNLAAAEAILAAPAAPGDLAAAARLAAITAAWQAEAVGAALGPPPALASRAPAEAAAALLARHGTAAPAALRQLDALPAPAGAALAGWIDAVAALEDARDVGGRLAAHGAVADAAARLQAALGGARLPIVLQVPPVLAISLAATDDTYAEDFVLLLDAGGDDTYRNNAGGSGVQLRDPAGLFRDCVGLTASPPRAAALLDLAGNDRYIGGRSCGANGGATDGAGALIDAAGDDLYVGGAFGTNGGGSMGGQGLLLDAGGDDVYLAQDNGVNGAATGTSGGRLIDLAGDDTYTAGQDEAVPQPARGATNGGASGGLAAGLLVDLAGRDRYEGEVMGANGGAEAGGVGFLLDGGDGDDVYLAGWGGTNGGAVYQGWPVGFLYDAGGDDAYRALDGAYDCNHDFFEPDVTCGGNGGAEDTGVGLLLDAAGNDAYLAGSYGANGGAWTESTETPVGHLIDRGGDDIYVATILGANGASIGLGLALLHDGGGRDAYVDGEPAGINGTGADCSVVPKGLVGAQLDTEGTEVSPACGA